MKKKVITIELGSGIMMQCVAHSYPSNHFLGRISRKVSDLAQSQAEPLAQLSLCLKWFSQKGSQLRPRVSNIHSGFLCHFCNQNILLMTYMFLV